ncbi:hypothetical protein [Salinimonas marina]|uniref:hypothetical protein n=1 Tax=Salinimonas marina TaxID=2785918 RepID=UPI001E5804C7|nr:hypothetical protein [Salinimonas marina]
MARHRHLVIARRHSFWLALPVSLVYLPGVAAQSETDSPPPTAYEQELKRQGRLIEQLQEQVNALKQSLQQKSANKKQEQTSRTKPSQSESSPEVARNTPEPVGQKPPEPEANTRALPENVSSGNGVLIGKDNSIWEASLSYSYTDNNRVFLDGYSFIPALVVGLIDIRQVKRHSFIGSVSTRYGLTDRWEFEVKVPYVYRDDTQRSRPVSIGVSEDEVFNANGEGWVTSRSPLAFSLMMSGRALFMWRTLRPPFLPVKARLMLSLSSLHPARCFLQNFPPVRVT